MVWPWWCCIEPRILRYFDRKYLSGLFCKPIRGRSLASKQLASTIRSCGRQTTLLSNFIFCNAPIANKLFKISPRLSIWIVLQENGHMTKLKKRYTSLGNAQNPEEIQLFKTYLILVMIYFIKMLQHHFRRVLNSLLTVLTGYQNLRALHPPPVWKPLAVIETGIHSLAKFFTGNLSIVLLRHIQAQSVSFNGKHVSQVVERAGVVSRLHVMPIGAFFLVGTTNNTTVSF